MLVVADDLLHHVVDGGDLYSWFGVVSVKGGDKRSSGLGVGGRKTDVTCARGEHLTAVLVVVRPVPANPVEAGVRVGNAGSVGDSVRGVVHHGLREQDDDVVGVFSPHSIGQLHADAKERERESKGERTMEKGGERGKKAVPAHLLYPVFSTKSICTWE